MLVFCLDVDLSTFSIRGIERLVTLTRQAERELCGTTVAIVAQQSLIHNFMRMYKPPFRLAAFHGADAARNWLAVTTGSRSV